LAERPAFEIAKSKCLSQVRRKLLRQLVSMQMKVRSATSFFRAQSMVGKKVQEQEGLSFLGMLVD
jgi:hypothetical protein